MLGVQAQTMGTSVREWIYYAATRGNLNELRRLQSLGYSLELTDANGNTPYCQAVWSQNKLAVATLIAAGVDVRPRCLRRIPYVTESRIYAAAHAEDLDQLVAWKKEGLNVDVVNPETGNSALCEAVYNYDCPAIQALLRAGSQQAQACMRRVPQEVRDNLQCRPIKIDWGLVGYSLIGAGMAGALVAVLSSGGSKGKPACTDVQRWIGDRCVNCDTCWIGNTCISEEMMKDKDRPYYRDEKTAACWQVSPPPVEMTAEELQTQAAKISNWTNSQGEKPYSKGNYLPQINAAEAYARGYTGYMVERTSPYGRLVNDAVSAGEDPTVTDKRVTVAVYSSGVTIGKGGTVSSTETNSGTSSTKQKTKNVWDWTGVNEAFYDKTQLDPDLTEYTPTGKSSSSQNTVTSTKIGYVDKVHNNFAANDSGTPYGYNFDYGPCGSRTENKRGSQDYTKNCYGVKDVTITGYSNPFHLAVLYNSSGGYQYVLKDPTTGVVNGYTTTEPTAENFDTSHPEKMTYVDYYNEENTGLYDQFFGSLKYDSSTTTSTGYYEWTADNGAAYNSDPSPHYTASETEEYESMDSMVGSKGTFLAGIVAAMKQDTGDTYGVAYNSTILPVNRDVVYGVSETAMQVMLQNAQIVLMDENVASIYEPATSSSAAYVKNDALAAFTYDSTRQEYTAREMSSLFGSNKSKAYSSVAQNNAVVVVPNGNVQQSSMVFMQPSLQSAIPLMSGFNNQEENATTWKIGDALPTVNTSNPLYHKYLTVGAVRSKTTDGVTYYDLETYSQPCGIAANYCVVAPGGQSASSNGIYSTTDPVKAGSGSAASYGYNYGTSLAAATVSGSLALLMGAYPHLTAQQAVEILLKTATYINLDDISPSNPIDAKTLIREYYGDEKKVTIHGEEYDLSYEAYDENLNHAYNAIFGYGLINLGAATDPIGGMNGLWVYKTGDAIGSNAGVVVSASATSIVSPASLTGALSTAMAASLPASFVAFDAYNRPFLYPTANLFQLQSRRKAKSWDDFKMFMNGRDPIEIQASEDFSMSYRDQTNRVSSSSQIPFGLVQATLKQDKMKYSLFYSQDTTLGTGAYWKRRQTNPFIQMKNAYGVSSGYQFHPKWSVEVGWTMGRNGFFDEDDRRFDAPDNKMQAFTNSLIYKPTKKLSLKLSSGVMKEKGSSLGMISSGAFGIKGADTQFVGAGLEYSPIDKVHLDAMYYYGQTKTKTERGLMNMSRLRSDSFALTASYEPTEDHLFGLQVSSPLRVKKGTLNVSLPVGRHPTEDIYYYNTYNVNMKPKARELDLSLYYQGNVSDEVSVQSELGVRLNPDHQSDVAPDYRGMVGMKWAY